MNDEKNEQNSNWKIDLSPSGLGIALYRKIITRGFFRTTVKWQSLDYFSDVESAKEKYEKIKNLPEYL